MMERAILSEKLEDQTPKVPKNACLAEIFGTFPVKFTFA